MIHPSQAYSLSAVAFQAPDLAEIRNRRQQRVPFKIFFAVALPARIIMSHRSLASLHAGSWSAEIVDNMEILARWAELLRMACMNFGLSLESFVINRHREINPRHMIKIREEWHHPWSPSQPAPPASDQSTEYDSSPESDSTGSIGGRSASVATEADSEYEWTD